MFLKWHELSDSDFSDLCPVVDEFRRMGRVVEAVPSSSHNKPKINGTYLLVHYKTRKVYVGSHGNLYARKYQHHSMLTLKTHWNKALQEAFNDDNRLIAMFIMTTSREEAFNIEQHILSTFLSSGGLFNISKDARYPGKDAVVSEETRLKLSLSGAGRKQSPDWIRKRTFQLRGRKQDPKITEYLRQKAILRGINPELTKKAALANSIKVYADGMVYASVIEAGLKNNIVSTAVIKRIRSRNFPTWHYARDIYNREISVNGVSYNSINDYSTKHDLDVNTVKLRIDSAEDIYKDWKYITPWL